MFAAAVKAFSGSKIASQYSVSKTVAFRSGPWSVYSGKRKVGEDAVCVFVFDKKELAVFLQQNNLPKSVSGEVYERLKQDVSNLTKLRHPAMVKIIEPLEDSRGTLTFVTEPVTSTVQVVVDQQARGNLDDLTVQKGLLQVVDGLLFLHNSAQHVHLNVQPSSILVDSKGDWKLFGLAFMKPYQDNESFYLPQYDPRLASLVQFNLDFSAPELVLDHRVDPTNDVFSLACLVYNIYLGKPPMNCRANSTTYRSEVEAIARSLNRSASPDNLPAYLQTVLPQLLSRDPLQRLSLENFKRSEFFDNPLIRALSFLDELPAKTLGERRTFLSGLTTMLSQFPKSVLQTKVLQVLSEELSKDQDLVYLTMKNILMIGDGMSQLTFAAKVLPLTQGPIQDVPGCQRVIVEYLDVLLSRLSPEDFRKFILPLMLRILDNGTPEDQVEILVSTERIIEKLNFVALKNDLFPAVSTVFGKTTSLAVKLESLISLKLQIAHGLDKYTVTEKLLPQLGAMKTREPKIVMAALEVFDSVIELVDTATLSKLIVPQMLALALESQLGQTQFRMYMDKIKDVLAKIEQQHIKSLPDTPVDTVFTTPSTRARPALQAETGASLMDFNDLISGKSKSTAPDALDGFGGLTASPPAFSSQAPGQPPIQPSIQPSSQSSAQTAFSSPPFSSPPSYSSPLSFTSVPRQTSIPPLSPPASSIPALSAPPSGFGQATTDFKQTLTSSINHAATSISQASANISQATTNLGQATTNYGQQLAMNAAMNSLSPTKAGQSIDWSSAVKAVSVKQSSQASSGLNLSNLSNLGNLGNLGNMANMANGQKKSSLDQYQSLL